LQQVVVKFVKQISYTPATGASLGDKLLLSAKSYKINCSSVKGANIYSGLCFNVKTICPGWTS
jgi:hypothetical protein